MCKFGQSLHDGVYISDLQFGDYSKLKSKIQLHIISVLKEAILNLTHIN